MYNQTVLGADGLHPIGPGYDKMSQLTSQTIKDLVQRQMSKQRTDKDHDGLYDQLEPLFGTSPKIRDTDGDGLPDGEEKFICGTDPAKLDTDGDGNPDLCVALTPAPAPTETPLATPTPEPTP